MTTKVLLIQLPIPQLNFGHQTGNIPLGAACLKQATAGLKDIQVSILPQKQAAYLGDAALFNLILRRRPDIIGFTTYVWNVKRTLHLARCIKQKYNPEILLGGPEATPDNPLVHDDIIDKCIYGEGEAQFIEYLTTITGQKDFAGSADGAINFSTTPSPYLHIPLDHHLEDTMLLETMRGCPYRCAYCYYNKSHGKPSFKANHLVLEGLKWALANNVSEIYLLDPSINSRPDLKALLKQIAAINKNHELTLISEIRAESIDAELADLFLAAGFRWFEIGLQTLNPIALKQMHRNTDPDRFLKGIQALKQRKIAAAVDLIVGLPGDDLNGFDQSIQFVADNGLHDDIQVFPLSLLPGTEFRQRAQELGLKYEKTPPYTIISTPTFSSDEILLAFDHAESRFDISLYPLPDLDVSWQTDTALGILEAKNVEVKIEEEELLYKVIINKEQGQHEWRSAAVRVSHPYQLIVPPDMSSHENILKALEIFTGINPHTPLEMIFFSPSTMPDINSLLHSAKLERPHYLDGDLRLLYAEPGNRAILFTVVSPDANGGFSGAMQRHVYWWQRPALPTIEQLTRLESKGIAGILVDSPVAEHKLYTWQDDMAPKHDDMMLIDFTHVRLHKRWLQKTGNEDYCLQILP